MSIQNKNAAEPTNHRKMLVMVLLMTGPVMATETAPPPADRESVLPETAEALWDDALQLVPADACFIAYTAEVQRLAKHKLLTDLAGAESGLPALAETLAGAIEGTAVVSASGLPLNPMSWRITFAARTSLGRDDLFQYLTTEVAPAWNRAPAASEAGEMQFLQVGELGRLMLVGPVPIFMTVATRDGLIFGSTRPGQAEDWLNGIDLGDSFVQSPEFERLNEGRSAPVGNLVYLDLRSLMPLVAMQLNGVLPTLAAALQVENLESVALISDPLTPPVKTAHTATPKRRTDVRLAVGVKSIDKGVLRLLASAPSPPQLARVFPANTKLLLHGSMDRATDLADDLAAFAGAIDQTIVEEYHQERAELKEELGFDPHGDFLANFAREWALGFTETSLADPLFAVRLADPAAFKGFMHRLRAAYKLEISRSTYRDTDITHAARQAGPFCYAVVDDVLLVSPQAAAINRAIDAALDNQGLAQTADFAAVRQSLGPRTSKLLFLRVAELFAEAVESGEAAALRELVELVRSRGALGLGIVPHDQMIALEFASSSGSVMGLVDVLSMTVVPSFRQARYQSQRTVSMSNIKAILLTCKLYANERKGQWPESLEALVAEGPRPEATVFVNPYQPDPESTVPFYLYRQIPDGEKTKKPWAEVAVSEPELHDGGAFFGFADGHVEWVESPRADDLLQIMRAAQ